MLCYQNAQTVNASDPELLERWEFVMLVTDNVPVRHLLDSHHPEKKHEYVKPAKTDFMDWR